MKKVKNGESITIISRGHEVARLVPPFDKVKNARKALEELRSTAFIGDADTHIIIWDALCPEKIFIKKLRG
ncbi:MAG TPA: hypothetical protein VK186_21240 [Candidatus Deferrimicrobium sp.]|nr:hypothetical protein [Candidatus Deferrimicrobium sp.]